MLLGARSKAATSIRPNTRHGYVAPLDGVRAIAIAAVLGYHAGPAPGGLFGVDIFLVLSGFLITSLLFGEWQRTGGISISRFYVRRVLRLLPAVVVSVPVFAGLSLVILPHTETGYVWWDVASIFGYFANVWESIHPMVFFGHFWSLSMEEQYYFVWPLLMVTLIGRVRTRTLVHALVAVSAASYVTGIVWWQLGGGATSSAAGWISTMLPTRGLGLFVGSGLALAVKAGMLPTGPRFHSGLRIAASLSVVLWIVLFRVLPYSLAPLQRDATYFGYLLFDLTAALVVLHATSGDQSLLNRVLSYRYMVLLGVWSYSLYVVHLPIFVFVNQAGLSGFAREPLMIVVSIGAAGVLHYTVERPFLALRARFHRPVLGEGSDDARRMVAGPPGSRRAPSARWCRGGRTS